MAEHQIKRLSSGCWGFWVVSRSLRGAHATVPPGGFQGHTFSRLHFGVQLFFSDILEIRGALPKIDGPNYKLLPPLWRRDPERTRSIFIHTVASSRSTGGYFILPHVLPLPPQSAGSRKLLMPHMCSVIITGWCANISGHLLPLRRCAIKAVRMSNTIRCKLIFKRLKNDLFD